jgi:DNA-binding NtrC family response regulator
VTTKRQILVLDDDAEQAELLAEAIASHAWEVRIFSDPIRALSTLQSEGVDLLIADLSMPWMDGGDVVSSARLRRPLLFVILVWVLAGGAAWGGRHDVTFFAKPVDLDGLRKTIAGLLEVVEQASI